MKRSSVSGPPRRGPGAVRTSAAPLGGGPAIASRSGSAPVCIGARSYVGASLPPPLPPLPTTAAELAERVLAGEKRALARAISLVENDDPEGWSLVREIYPKTGRAAVAGFTGPPGV